MADRPAPQQEQYIVAERSGHRETSQRLPDACLASEAGGPAGYRAPQGTSPPPRRESGARQRMRRGRSNRDAGAVQREDFYQRNRPSQEHARRGPESGPFGTQHRGGASSAVQASGGAHRRMNASSPSTSGAVYFEPEGSTRQRTSNRGPPDARGSRRQRGQDSRRPSSQTPIFDMPGVSSSQAQLATPPRTREAERRPVEQDDAGRVPTPPLRHPPQAHGRRDFFSGLPREAARRRTRAVGPRLAGSQQAESLGKNRSLDVAVPQSRKENNAPGDPPQAVDTVRPEQSNLGRGEAAEVPSSAREAQPPWKDMAAAASAPVGSGRLQDEEHACVVCSCPIAVRSMCSCSCSFGGLIFVSSQALLRVFVRLLCYLVYSC